MKILFTGSNGFLGKNLIPLLRESHKVFTIDFMDSDYQCDISKDLPCFENESFDLVFHAAGKAHSIPKNEMEEKVFFEVNLVGTKNLCKALENNRLPKIFIFISTVAVYGKETGNNIPENHPLNGKTPYARSKIQAELFLEKWCTENNVKLIILRPSLIAGKNPPGNLGDMIKAMKRNKYLNIDQGKARKSIFFVNDFVFIIENAYKMKQGVYNVCDTNHPSFKELSFLIATQLNKNRPFSIPLSVANLIAKLGDLFGNKAPINSLKLSKIVNSLTFSNTKISQELNWNPSDVLNNFRL